MSLGAKTRDGVAVRPQERASHIMLCPVTCVNRLPGALGPGANGLAPTPPRQAHIHCIEIRGSGLERGEPGGWMVAVLRISMFSLHQEHKIVRYAHSVGGIPVTSVIRVSRVSRVWSRLSPVLLNLSKGMPVVRTGRSNRRFKFFISTVPVKFAVWVCRFCVLWPTLKTLGDAERNARGNNDAEQI